MVNESSISDIASVAAATTLFRFTLVIVAVLMRPADGLVFAQFPDMRETIENQELNRCGPYALQACANYLGLTVRQEGLREKLPDGEETTFNQLADLAKREGMIAVPIRWASDPIMLSSAPAILATNKNGTPHFVAALAKRGGQVYIVDLPHAGWMRLQVLREKLHWKGESLHVAKSILPILCLYGLLYYKWIMLGIIAIVGLLLVIRRMRTRISDKRAGCRQQCGILVLLLSAASVCSNFGCGQEGPVDSIHVARVEPEEVTVDRSKEANPEDGEAETVLRIVNDGRSEITIRSIVSSCRCATVDDPSGKSLHPGETASVLVQLSLPRHGERLSRIKILVEAGSIQQTLLARILMRGLPIQTPAVINAPETIVMRCDAKGNATTTMRVIAHEKVESRPWIEQVTVEPEIVAVQQMGMKEADSTEPGVVERAYS